MNSTPLLDQFKKTLSELHPEQAKAVRQTEGPVLVIAGPGTGKTHVLASRIGHILQETDTPPQSILCLTFTDAGAQAMRRRLLRFMGPEAHQIAVYTFHAFCNRVIRENPEYFGRSGLEPISDLERIEVIRRLLDQLPPDHPLKDGYRDPYQYEQQLGNLMSLMKKEGWKPGFVHRQIERFLAELPQRVEFIYQKNGKGFKKGDLKTSLIQDKKLKMERLRAAADLYPKYTSALKRISRYEYEDMILWVNEAFANNEFLLRNYQEKYLYFLVDEFQDTNGAQKQLIDQLINYWESPNIFIVGDDDQSIYEFQGARLKNLLDFYHHYRDQLEMVVLTENYRSTPDILDAAHELIEQNQLRAVHAFEVPISKKLHSQKPTEHRPFVAVYDTRLAEESDIALQIRALIAAGTPPHEIAVLYRRHKESDRLANLLTRLGVPFETKKNLDIQALPLVRNLIELLRYLNEERRQPFAADHKLFRIFHAQYFGFSTWDLAEIAAFSAAQAPAENQFWRYKIADEALLHSLKIAHPERFTALSRHLEQWIRNVTEAPLPELLEQIITQSGMLRWASQKRETQPELLAALSAFHAFVTSETQRNHKMTLGKLLEILDSMEANQLRIPAAPVDAGVSKVQLLTAHAAKGLEFDTVFLFDATADNWESARSNAYGNFPLPDTLTFSGAADETEASRRLFYVAMTRAKSALQISYSKTDNDGKTLTPSMFIGETKLVEKSVAVPAPTLYKIQEILLTQQEMTQITLPDSERLSTLLENYALSITGLNRYLRCPIAFFYEDLLKAPASMSEAAAYGQAIHMALQAFFVKMKNDKQQRFPEPLEAEKLFAKEMEAKRGFFAEPNFNQRLALGRQNLKNYLTEQLPTWRKQAVVERRFEKITFSGIPITGVLDKIEWTAEKKLHLVDYKTGTYDAAKTAPPSEKQPFGGDYWRQLYFYKLLTDQARAYAETASSGAIIWLSPDKSGKYKTDTVTFSPDHIDFMGELLRETWGKIQRLEFTTGCGEDTCLWCNLFKTREPDVVFTKPEEQLDD